MGMRCIAWLSRLWIVSLLLGFTAAPFAFAQSGPSLPTQIQTDASDSPLHVTGYNIDVTLDPAHHSLRAQTTVRFTALQPLTMVSFQLNPALRVTSITDAAGNLLNAEWTSPDILGTATLSPELASRGIKVTPPTSFTAGEAAAWTFTYNGVFGTSENGAATSPASIQFASIGDSASYLLYAARWFPIVGDGTDRFTMTMHIHVPIGERVFASGLTGTPHPDANGKIVYDFVWARAGFPGTIIAGKFTGPFTPGANPNLHVYLEQTKTDAGTAIGLKIAATAAKEYSFFASQFGPLPSNPLNVVELPDDTLPAYSAPEIAAIASRQLQGENSSRLLANTIAHQWWGNEVSPTSRDDAWITNGMSRYAELAFLESTASPTAFSDAILNVSASALAYDTIPLADATRYAPLSPEFQAMTYDKGAMIFRMLQWQIGDVAFQQTLRGILSDAANKAISTADLEKIAESASTKNLRPFFTQWLDSTGAPTLQNKWTLYRLDNNQGFRTVGEIDQDLDLFQMPVDIRVETEGKTVNQRVDVSGPSSQFVIDTVGMPRKITLDPDRWLLRNSPDMQVRVHILRGQQMAANGDSSGAIREYQQALAIDSISSLGWYRLGEVYFGMRNYQAAADAFRSALSGDGEPKWTEVWSDLQLGKIFDASGQRDRAVNQYREALQTQDNTSGALDLAREYLQHAYRPSPR